MRAGTQTLIQALQAIPWTTAAEDADDSGHNTEDSADESDDDRSPSLVFSLLSAQLNTPV